MVCRKTFPRKVRRTADPSASLRDDKKGRADDRERVVAKGKGVGRGGAGLKREDLVVQGKVVFGRKASPLATILSLSPALPFLSSRAADSLKRVGREMTGFPVPATKAGCPTSRSFFARCGIPRSSTRNSIDVIRSEAEGSAVSFSDFTALQSCGTDRRGSGGEGSPRNRCRSDARHSSEN